MAEFSGGEVASINEFVAGKQTNEWLRLQREGNEYLMMTHYNMGLNEVRELTPDDARQLIAWAVAMRKKEKATQTDSVYLGYDYIPPLE